MTLCLNSFKGQHSFDLRPVNELPGGLAVQRQQQLPLIQTVHRRLVKAETRPSFLGLEEWIIDELNRLHILMLWGKVYGKESQREREWSSSKTSSVLWLFALWHQFAPVYSSFIFMCLLMHTFLYVSEGTRGMCTCVLTARSNNKNHTSTGHIFQVCLTHLKC